MRFDTIVIGLEPAACDAALEASRQGLEVLLVHAEPSESADNVGSVGMHLLREAIVQEQMASGILTAGGSPSLDVRGLTPDRLQQRRIEVGSLQRTTLRRRVERSGIRVVESDATFTSPSRVLLSGSEEHEAPIVVVAAGSRPRRPTRFAFDDQVVCDYESVFGRKRLPRKLLVVGADDIGCEIACIYAALQATVTAIDRRSRLLRSVDRALLQLLHARMQSAGIETVLQEELREIEVHLGSSDPHAVVTLESGRVEIADCVVVCAGRSPKTDGLGLEAIGVETDVGGFIAVNDRFETSVQGVYAAGSVIAGPSRASGAWQGRVAMRNALGLTSDPPIESPLSIYSIPEISTIGITEEMCRYLDVHCAVGSAHFRETLWGQIRSDQDGMLKLVVDQTTRKLIGVHAIGAGASDLIHIGASLLIRGGTVDELADGSFIPTSPAEAYAIAAQAVLCDLPAAEAAAGSTPIGRF